MLGAAAARNLGSVFQNVDLEHGFVDELDPGLFYQEQEDVEEPEFYDVIFGGQIHQVQDGAMADKSRRKLKKLFRLIDSDGNNYFNTGFAYGSDVLDKPNITDAQFKTVFDEVNKTNDGVVDFKELWDFLKPWNAQKADSKDGHGDLYCLLKYKFLKAMSHPIAKDVNDHFERIGNRFKKSFKVIVPTAELVDFESKLIGGNDGYGLYVGQDMPVSASKIPTGSILVSVGGKVIEGMKSQDLRNLIHFTEDHENCVCLFKNYGALSKLQRENIPGGAWQKLTKRDRADLQRTERVTEREYAPFFKENYPPGHNRHTPDKRKRPWAYRLHRTMEDETYSSLSFLITIFVMTMIIVSTLAYILETVPPLEDQTVLWTTIETSVSIAFTLEYILRIISCKNMWAYFWDVMNLVDFLAFIPFWIEIVSGEEGSALRVIRVIRLARIIRLMKSPTFSTYLIILENTFRSAVSSLGLLVTISLLEIIVCGSLAYVAEGGSPKTIGVCDDWINNTDISAFNCTGGVRYNFSIQYSNQDCLMECVDSATAGCCEFNQKYLSCVLYTDDSDEELVQGEVLSQITPQLYSSNCVTEEVVLRFDGLNPFYSIPNSMWWCVVTMTTVGYGDMAPIYVWGRCIGILTMFSGLLVIALPVIIIGKDFENANTDQTRKNNRKQSSLDALALLKNDRRGTVEEFFKEVNDYFKSQYNKQKESGISHYEYQAVSFNHNDESSFYEAGFTSKHQIEAILSCKRGFVYLPNYLHIPAPHASGYKSIPMYSVFSLWHYYGQLLRKGKTKMTHRMLKAGSGEIMLSAK